MRPLLWLLPLIFVSSTLFSQHKNIAFSKPPAWTQAIDYNVAAMPADSEATSSYYLLADEQENVLTQERYFHYVYKILSTEGIQNMSDLSFDFDPSYQSLTLHNVRIIRGNETIDKLSKDIKVVQREQNMDRYLYDESLTAIVHLKDVRVNDVIEYAFTRKGYNPVYAGHLTRAFYFNNVAAEKGSYSIILSSSKPYQFRFANGEEKAAIRENVAGGIRHSWSFGKVSRPVADNNVPNWFDPYYHVLISDFSSWSEVEKWAKQLFEVKPEDQRKITQLAAKEFPEASPVEYAAHVIRFVQDEVRYLGFESGLNSHKPHAPMQVYEQRFGDCKDKSLLLVTLLRAQGIEAYPVLVSTVWGDRLKQKLPSANGFDHCVVKFVLNEKERFVDPTINNQGGGIFDIAFPDYGVGLVVGGSDDLNPLSSPVGGSVEEEQIFDVVSIGGEAMMTVRTTFRGAEADYQRSTLAGTDRTSLQKGYTEYYANLYKDITKWEDMKVTDVRDSNTLIIEEKYKIPTFWPVSDGNKDVVVCETYAQTLERFFNVSGSTNRTSPYKLSYPTNYSHSISLNLPESWPGENQDENIETDYYRYRYTVKNTGSGFFINRHYETLKPEIPQEAFATFLADHEKMMNQLSYRIQYDYSIAKAGDSIIPGLIVTLLVIVGSVYAVFAIHRKYDPIPVFDEPGIPISGWLILLGIGVVFSPFVILYEISQDVDVLTGRDWMIWFASKSYGLGTYAFITENLSVFRLLFSAMVALQFFQRRSSFPRLMQIAIATNLLLLISNVVVIRLRNEGIEYDSTDLVRGIFSALIWIPYLSMSSTVRETFVMRSDYRRDDRETPKPVEEINEIDRQ